MVRSTYGHVFAYVGVGIWQHTFTVNEGGRTDLDHTSSHGVSYGYTLTKCSWRSKAVGSGKRLLGFIYPAAVPPSNPQIALGQNWFDLADNVYVGVKPTEQLIIMAQCIKMEQESGKAIIRMVFWSFLQRSLALENIQFMHHVRIHREV